jgi:hypothetical protein
MLSLWPSVIIKTRHKRFSFTMWLVSVLMSPHYSSVLFIVSLRDTSVLLSNMTPDTLYLTVWIISVPPPWCICTWRAVREILTATGGRSVGTRLPANREVGHKVRQRQQWTVWGKLQTVMARSLLTNISEKLVREELELEIKLESL